MYVMKEFNLMQHKYFYILSYMTYKILSFISTFKLIFYNKSEKPIASD